MSLFAIANGLHAAYLCIHNFIGTDLVPYGFFFMHTLKRSGLIRAHHSFKRCSTYQIQ